MIKDFVREKLMRTFRDCIGVESDNWITIKSLEWWKDGYLKDEDIQELQNLIDAKNAPAVMEGIPPDMPEGMPPDTMEGMPADERINK